MAGIGGLITGMIPGLTSFGLGLSQLTDPKVPRVKPEKASKAKLAAEKAARNRQGFRSTILAAQNAEEPTVGTSTLLGVPK